MDQGEFFKGEIGEDVFESEEIKNGFLKRVTQGSLAEKENQQDHLIVYFVPYNPLTKQVYLVFDLKTGLWLFPGGHMHQGENPRDSLKREVQEELAFELSDERIHKPFLVTKTRSTQEKRGCVWHWDIWYKVETDGQKFKPTDEEFRQTKWLTVAEAQKDVVDSSTLQALRRIGSKHKSKA